MKLKLDDAGKPIFQGDHPIYIFDDGTEAPFDAKAAHVALATAKREAGEARTEKKAAEDQLATFSGIEDPAAALKALQFAQSMEGKKAMDDEGIKKLVEAAVKPLQTENETLKESVKAKDGTIYQMQVSDKFNTSVFLKEKTLFGETPDIAESYFGKHFKIEDGKTVAYDRDGNPIWSTVTAGKHADFDEALSFLVNSHPRKDHILKGTQASGSGSQGSQGASQTNKFDHLKPTDRITAAREAGLKT